MRPEDRIRVLHMIKTAQTAPEFIAGRERTDLDTDRMLLFALVRAIEVLGEAAAKVTEDTRAGASTVPWTLIVAMRNRLIHAYFDIDREFPWKIVIEAIGYNRSSRASPRSPALPARRPPVATRKPSCSAHSDPWSPPRPSSS